MSHTLRSGTDGHMGNEDQDSYYNGTEECYTVTFHVERVTPSVDVPVDRMIRVADAVEVLGNPSTTNNVSFRIANNTPGRVRAEVFDVSGRRVRTVVDRDCPAGSETLVWDGADEAGRRVQQGAYFLRVVIGDGRFTSTKRLVLLR